jgi:phosphohistidine phosphatase SixA
LIFKPTNRELLASLLVMVILVCHGAYGVNHQYVCETLAPQHSGETVSHGSSQAPASGGEQEPGAGHLSYLMALFSVLAAALYLRLRGVPLPRATLLKLTFRERLPDIERHLPQLTSPPVLQVFRL